VASITLSDASTTVTYDGVVISQYSNIQTPTVVAISFPEYNSVGSVTSVFGSVIIGKGGTALIHPPNLPTAGGVIGPPGFGGPIRPPSGSSGCPSFFGVRSLLNVIVPLAGPFHRLLDIFQQHSYHS